jgi:hypothetical protein
MDFEPVSGAETKQAGLGMTMRCRVLCFLWALLAAGVFLPAWAAVHQTQEKTEVFFSLGHAVYSAQDHAKSQQEAIHDFQAQAVTQAAGNFLSPAEMGSKYKILREKVLSQAERYVQSYQIFSETPSEGGLYRMTGQVHVSMDLLRVDLEELGIIPEGAAPWKSSPSESGESPVQVDASSVDPGTPPGDEESLQPAEALHRESPGRKILWVVSEKWDATWSLPQDETDTDGLFAQSVLQESEDYDWRMRFPEGERLDIGERGNVSNGQALALARRQNVPAVILGALGLREKQGEPSRLELSLRVLNVDAGKSLGEIKEERNLGDDSPQEGAMALAASVVPRLNSLLGSTDSASAVRPPQVESGKPAKPVPVGEPGEWALHLRTQQPYIYWQKLEKVLRKQFASMEVSALELSPSEGVVRLKGVDGSFFQTMDGMDLSGNIQVKVDELVPESRLVRVSFVPSTVPRKEMQQKVQPPEEVPDSETPQTESEQ